MSADFQRFYKANLPFPWKRWGRDYLAKTANTASLPPPTHTNTQSPLTAKSFGRYPILEPELNQQGPFENIRNRYSLEKKVHENWKFMNPRSGKRIYQFLSRL